MFHNITYWYHDSFVEFPKRTGPSLLPIRPHFSVKDWEVGDLGTGVLIGGVGIYHTMMYSRGDTTMGKNGKILLFLKNTVPSCCVSFNM